MLSPLDFLQDLLNPDLAFLPKALGEGGIRTAEQMFAMIDALSETADERAEEILGDLYDYADGMLPEA